jgi:uncharacterized protein (DUF305 family)
MQKFVQRHFFLGIILYATVYSPGSFGHEGMATTSSGDAHHKMHQAMDGMHKDMMGMKSKGDVDQDFVSMMIRHHQGAIEMAQVELAEGKDPRAKEFARKIIDQQKKEIEELQNWQKSQGGAKRASK